MSIFGGIFKIWFGGKAKARRIGQIRLKLQNANTGDDSEEPDDNAPGSDGGPDVSQQIPGVLALDRNGDGVIDPNADTNFKNDKDGATSVLEGLQSFDANEDGLLDFNDPEFQKFGIWNDANNDGIYQSEEFQTLPALGIESIDLASGLTNGLLLVTRTDGTAGQLALSQSVSFP